jgi:hypothetical protein
MTPLNIEEHYVRFAKLETSNSNIKKIISMVSGSEVCVFDDRAVRVKMILADETVVLLDNIGCARRDPANAVLSTRDLRKLADLFEEVTIPRKR